MGPAGPRRTGRPRSARLERTMRSMAVSLGRLEVETADHVVLRYDLAGVGTRGSAALVDGLLSLLMVIGLTIGAAIIGSKLPGAAATPLAGVPNFAVLGAWAGASRALKG